MTTKATPKAAAKKTQAAKPVGLQGNAAAANPEFRFGGEFFVNPDASNPNVVAGAGYNTSYTPTPAPAVPSPSTYSRGGTAPSAAPSGGGGGGGGFDSYEGLTRGMAAFQRPQLSPYEYDPGKMPDDFMNAFNSARGDDARRYTDLTNLSNTAGQRYDQNRQFVLDNLPKKNEYTDQYDNLLNWSYGQIGDRQKQADTLFREGLGAISGAYGNITSGISSDGARKSARVTSALNDALPAIGNAGTTAANATRGYTDTATANIADLLNDSNLTPAQRAYLDSVKGVASQNTAGSIPLMTQEYKNQANTTASNYQNQISDATNAALRSAQAQQAGVLAGYYGDQQGNLNDILFKGMAGLTGIVGGRADALNNYASRVNDAGANFFQGAHLTNQDQIAAATEANRTSDALMKYMDASSARQLKGMDLTSADRLGQLTADTDVYNNGLNAFSNTGIENIRANNNLNVANLNNASAERIASGDNSTKIDIARMSNDASYREAILGAKTSTDVARINGEFGVKEANIQASSNNYGADQVYAAKIAEINAQTDWQKYAADKDYRAQVDSAKAKAASDLQIARLGGGATPSQRAEAANGGFTPGQAIKGPDVITYLNNTGRGASASAVSLFTQRADAIVEGRRAAREAAPDKEAFDKANPPDYLDPNAVANGLIDNAAKTGNLGLDPVKIKEYTRGYYLGTQAQGSSGKA